MNRSLTNVLFGGIAAPVQSDYKIEGQITKTSVEEAVDALTNAENVILVCCFLYSSYGEFTNSHHPRWSDTVWPLRKHSML